LIEIDCDDIEIVEFDKLVIYMLILMWKKFLNVIIHMYTLFEKV